MEENKETVENVNVEETGGAVTQTEQKNEEKSEKTFTQEEVNSMLKKEKQKAEKKYEGIDITKYKEWQESQKTAEQKQAEKETEYQKTLSEKESLFQENQVLKAGVNVDDVDYVVFKVSKMDGEFEENLAKFLKDNPKYLGQELETEHKATGAPVKTLSSEESGVTAILKAKHPELFEK
jgi:hypothetical protein